MMDEQLIRQTVRAHHLMQLGSYITELTDIRGVRLAYTNQFPNIWYNSAYDIQIEPAEVDDLLQRIETFMARRDRVPAIYVSPATKPANLGELLEQRGYERIETEVWFFWDVAPNPKPYISPSGITIEDLQTDADLDVFAHIYRRGLPSAEVDLKIQACIDTFKFKSPLVDVRYFVARYHGEPAGMYTSLTFGDYCGIYAVTTLAEFQRKGIMRSLMHHAASLTAQKGVTYQFLQCVVGTKAEMIYTKLGYTPQYTRDCYVPTRAKGIL